MRAEAASRPAFALSSTVMAVDSYQVTCNATGAPEKLVSTDLGGVNVLLHNKGAVSVFIGDDAVDNTGYELAADEALSCVLAQGEELYGEAASATARVDVLLTGAGG